MIRRAIKINVRKIKENSVEWIAQGMITEFEFTIDLSKSLSTKPSYFYILINFQCNEIVRVQNMQMRIINF
jgi:hypothetical protein